MLRRAVRRNEHLLDFLLELQVLDRVPRMGFLLRGVSRPESVADHSWHVTFLVWVLGQRIADLDSTRALELALIHDLAEARLGDLPRTAGKYLPHQAKHQAERDLLEEMAGPEAGRILGLLDEYQRGESPEARLVKACDKLQLMLKIHTYERWGEGALEEFWDNPENFPDGGFDEVRELFAALVKQRTG